MNERKRAAIEFTLHWQSPAAVHEERYFIARVDFWRDLFPGSMGATVRELPPGGSWTERFEPGTLVPAYSERNIVAVASSSFDPDRGHGKSLPESGRFYPKGQFWRALHSYPGRMDPVRVIAADDASVTVDTNHPLARSPLSVTATVHAVAEITAQRGGSLQDIAEVITTGGPGMQVPLPGSALSARLDEPLRRDDETDDRIYYRSPRLVHHLDEQARQHVRSVYGRLLKPGTRILDLMSSWESHLPAELDSCTVVGLGLNGEEMAANPRLSSHLVHDLNDRPALPFPDDSFDAAICTVSIEYLCRPMDIVAELARVIRPGGIVAAAVSERWFPGKEIHPWRELHPFERLGFVLNYFLGRDDFTGLHTESVRGYPRPPGDRYEGQLMYSDPLYFVSARRGPG